MAAYKRRRFASVILAAVIAGFLPAASVFAAAVVSEIEGDVRVGATIAASRPAARGERLLPGSTVSTAAGSRAILSFDDGQVAALHENTQLRIESFRYELERPADDRAALRLLRGALRIVTGALGQRKPAAFSLRTEDTTIGVRGTDFMVAMVNPVYLSVLQGRIAAANSAGTALFEAGQFGVVASGRSLATAVRGNALPAAAASAFGGLGALPIAPPAPPGAGGVKVPDRAVSQPQESAAFGRETADKARALKEDLARKSKKAAAEAVRERARDNGPASRQGPR
jgi:hypothetical protein